MTKNDFTYVEDAGEFVAAINGMEVTISENHFSDETIRLAENVAAVYPQKIAAIAEHISKEDWFEENYNLSVEEIVQKLNAPSILIVDKKGGTLSYCDNEIDFDHILDVEFGGVLETFDYVSMDG